MLPCIQIRQSIIIMLTCSRCDGSRHCSLKGHNIFLRNKYVSSHAEKTEQLLRNHEIEGFSVKIEQLMRTDEF